MPDHAYCLPVDIDWLVATLQSVCGSTQRLICYKSERIMESTGLLSRICRVEFNWEEEEANTPVVLPRSVLIKQPSTWKLEEINQDTALQFDLSIVRSYHNRECHAYEYFNRHELRPPVPLVRCFFAQEATSDSLTEGLLILEDMTPMALAKNIGDDCNMQQLLVMVEAIASAHAYSVNYPDFLSLCEPFPYNVFYQFFDQFETSVDEMLLECGSCPFSKDDLLRMWQDVKADFVLQIDPRTKGSIPVLCHGDLQVNNILWRKKTTDPSTPGAHRTSTDIVNSNLKNDQPNICSDNFPSSSLPSSVTVAENNDNSSNCEKNFRELSIDFLEPRSYQNDLTSNELMALIDFQICAPGYPMQDLANLILWATPIEHRLKYRDLIIQTYLKTFYSKLDENVAQLNTSLKVIFSEENLTESYCQFLFQFAMVGLSGYSIYSKVIEERAGRVGVAKWIERTFSGIQEYCDYNEKKGETKLKTL